LHTAQQQQQQQQHKQEHTQTRFHHFNPSSVGSQQQRPTFSLAYDLLELFGRHARRFVAECARARMGLTTTRNAARIINM
jgi:hypothetical protein